jgi:hypothetical protein
MNLRITEFKSINKRSSLNLGGILCLIGAVYLIFSVLIRNSVAPSIGSIFSFLNHCSHWHVVAVALLPIYVALMIFGTATAGIYLGSTLHRLVVYFFGK